MSSKSHSMIVVDSDRDGVLARERREMKKQRGRSWPINDADG